MYARPPEETPLINHPSSGNPCLGRPGLKQIPSLAHMSATKGDAVSTQKSDKVALTRAKLSLNMAKALSGSRNLVKNKTRAVYSPKLAKAHVGSR